MSLTLTIAQLTDTHLFGDAKAEFKGINTLTSLTAVVNKLQQLSTPVDLILLTGDLSQDETEQSYQNLDQLLQPLEIPIYSIPGNHDHQQMMTKVLAHKPFYPDKLIHRGGWQIILLNSAVTGQSAGYLSPESLTWLEEQLQSSNLLTLIALHHHVLPIGSEGMDEMNLLNSGDFLALVESYPQIKIVLCGHIHQEFDSYREKVRYLGTPSTCIQLTPKTKEITIEQEFSPGFRLITLFPDGSFTTTVERVRVF